MPDSSVRGLISSNDAEFISFFRFVQGEAEKLGTAFFADVADPRETWVDGMHAEDMFGWLVPLDVADDFENTWRDQASFARHQWSKFFVVERWDVGTSGNLSVSFKRVEPIEW